MIYHCSVSSIQRSQGHSAVAAAAYRAGVCLQDERYGESHDYTGKAGVLATGIVGWPEGKSREELWNAAEAAENRCDAVVAREVRLALPNDLPFEIIVELVRNHAIMLAEEFCVAVDHATHAPSAEGDERNCHAHILLTARPVDPKTGEFARLKDRRWNFGQNQQTVALIRQMWEEYYNSVARKYGKEEIDSRSYSAQGIDKIPGKHMGRTKTAMIRKGVKFIEDETLIFEPIESKEIKSLKSELMDIESRIAIMQHERKLLEELPSGSILDFQRMGDDELLGLEDGPIQKTKSVNPIAPLFPKQAPSSSFDIDI